MTRKLILIRHAKSAWDDPTLDDHSRVLNERGRRSATAIGKWLADAGHVPTEIRSSDSARTTETVERVLASMAHDVPSISFVPRLYLAGPGTLLDEVVNASGEALAIVAHNPGIADFAAAMVSAAPDHHRFHDYPTGAVTVIEFDIDDWSKAAPRQGTALDFVIPRELE